MAGLMGAPDATPSSGDEVTIFMHIPKTAGTTLRAFIAQNYPERETYRTYKLGPRHDVAPVDLPAGVRYAEGHEEYGRLDAGPRKARYLTMLRDPIERVLSEFYYLQLDKSHDPYISAEIEARGLDLLGYVRSEDERFLLRTRNMQTRYACGLRTVNGIDVDLARENLRDVFSVVGVTERFDASVALMRKVFGWHGSPRRRLMVNRQRMRVQDHPDSVIDHIRECNSMDLALHDWAKRTLAKA